MLKVGDTALDFDLESDKGGRIKLFEKVAKATPLLLVFYKYNCPTCQFAFQYLPRISNGAGIENYLTVAQRLESWGMLTEARKFADEALKRAPEDSVKVWARILSRQQQYETVFLKFPALKSATATQVAQTVGAVAASYSPADKAKFAASIEKQPSSGGRMPHIHSR